MKKFLKNFKRKIKFFALPLILGFVISLLIGGFAGYLVSKSFFDKFSKNLFGEKFSEEIINKKNDKENKEIPIFIPEEQAVTEVVKKASPAVVSIVATKDLPIIEERFIDPFEEFFNDPFFRQFFGEKFRFQIPKYEQKGTQKQEVASGSGFLISSNGLILTNRHVIEISGAEFTVILNDGRKYQAKILGKDPVLDLAILKIEGGNFPFLTLGDSDKLQIGQTVIAIGNALGEFRNTVSKGVISGLARSIVASSGSESEKLEKVIQTDAAINKGNSGGPLLNLKGEVIGVNTAIVLGAQNIGFAIPINQAKKDIEQIKNIGKIVVPFLGIRYVILDERTAKENNLPVNYGALILKGERNEPGIIPDSPAQKAGLKEGDIILEMDGEKISQENTLAEIIVKKNVGQKVSLKILREGREFLVEVVLEERK